MRVRLLAIMPCGRRAGDGPGPATTQSSPSGPFEQTAIRRPAARGTSASPASGSPGSALPGRWDMAKVPLALGGVLVLIFGMRALGKKLVPGVRGQRASRAVQVLVRSPVSPRQQLMLVQVGRRLVLVGNSGSEMSSLCQIDDPDEVAEVLGQVAQDKGGSAAASFRALFGRAGKPYAEPEPDDDEPDHPEAPAVQTAVDGGTDPLARI